MGQHCQFNASRADVVQSFEFDFNFIFQQNAKSDNSVIVEQI